MILCDFQPTPEVSPAGTPLWRCPTCKSAVPSRSGKIAAQECGPQRAGGDLVSGGAIGECTGCGEKSKTARKSRGVPADYPGAD